MLITINNLININLFIISFKSLLLFLFHFSGNLCQYIPWILLVNLELAVSNKLVLIKLLYCLYLVFHLFYHDLLSFISSNWFISSGFDPDINPDEEEEKQRLINQVLELQNTLDGIIVSF